MFGTENPSPYPLAVRFVRDPAPELSRGRLTELGGLTWLYAVRIVSSRGANAATQIPKRRNQKHAHPAMLAKWMRIDGTPE
jgi:hypothetical protein